MNLSVVQNESRTHHYTRLRKGSTSPDLRAVHGWMEALLLQSEHAQFV